MPDVQVILPEVVVVVVLAEISPPPLLVTEIGEMVLSALKAKETCEVKLDVLSFLHDTITMLTIITGRQIIKIVFFIFLGFGLLLLNTLEWLTGLLIFIGALRKCLNTKSEAIFLM
jgi:hypothetical protein